MDLHFSKWVLFADRQILSDMKYPGLYALAICEANIAGRKFNVRKEIAYFGMTISKLGIRGRLKQFGDTLQRKRDNHGGAQRFRHDYKDSVALLKNLYVAVCPFQCLVDSLARKDLETLGTVAYAEFVAFANYAEAFGRLPKYNDKKNSPKA